MLDISPTSNKNQFRGRRVEAVSRIINSYIARNGSCTVLDLGGTSGFWSTWRDHFDFERTAVTCVNLDTGHEAATDFTAVVTRYGDATDLAEFADKSFDVVFSISVVEHVGDWSKMKQFAAEAKRIGRSYFIQTPYFWFPVEPHARTPFLHWLPQSWAYRIVMAKRCGYWPKAGSVSEAVDTLQSARMLDYGQFAALFDDAPIERERFLGLTKSLVAVRHAEPALAG
jgi:2-polyprenyl-3-methyl-5-hydroxy-6-metoxy-1,4-benzoquinol methylase